MHTPTRTLSSPHKKYLRWFGLLHRSVMALLFILMAPGSVHANWSSNFGSWTPGSTRIADVAADSAGNAYAIGQTTAMTLNIGGVTLSKTGNTDSFVVKRNPDGSIAWVKSIGGIGAAANAYAITVDSNGDVYATGFVSSGDLTVPTALARINRGVYQNTYVIKFAGTDGAVQWAKAFGATGNAGTIPSRLAADGNGNLYVLGYFNGANLTTPALTKIGSQDAYLFKLNATDGSLTWATNFGGYNANATLLSSISPTSVTIDASGEVYLTGAFDKAMTSPAVAAMGGLTGFVFKIDKTNGSVTWTRRIGTNNPSSYIYVMGLAIDSASSRAYLVGKIQNGTANQLDEPVLATTGATQNGFILQLDTSNGNVNTQDSSLWMKAYGGSTGSKMYPSGIVRTSDGKLYVGGYFMGANLTVPALTKNGNTDGFSMRVSAVDGAVDWVGSAFGGSGVNVTTYSSVGVDGSGNVFLGGYFDTGNLTTPAINLSQSGATDALLVKYAAADGAVAASASYSGGNAGSSLVLRESTFDSAGNLYVVGDFTGTSATLGAVTLNRIGTQDALVAKLDASGTVQWAKNYGGVGATVTGESIAVDDSGNVYATSLYSGASLTTPSLAKTGTKDALVLKLSATDGSTLSREQVFGATGTSVQSAKIRLAGSVAVLAGAFSGGNLTNPSLTKVGTQDVYVTYLDSSFSINLNKSYGVLSGTTGLTGFAADSSGAVYLTGSFNTSLTTPALTKTGTTDGYAMKVTGCLSNLCAVAWANSYGGASATVNVNGLRVDGSGNVYVAGTVAGGNVTTTTPTLAKTGTKDTFALKLNASGFAQWAQIFGGNSATMNSPLGGLAIGNSKVYLSGDFNAALSTPALTPTGSNDAYVITLADSDGSVSASTNLGGSATTVTNYGISAQSDGTYAAVGSFATANLSGLSLTRKGSTDGWIQRTTLGATPPDAPTGVTASAGNAQASVSWSAPANTGGAAISGYTVTASSGGGTCTTTGATTCTVTGLTNGTAYTFTVTASNGSTSVASSASNSVTPSLAVTAPGAPTIGTATAGDGQATVTFTAPASSGSAAITTYTATSSPDGLTGTCNGPTACTITVTGLSNGTPYTFTVTASNGATSSPSAPSNQVTPSAASVPDAPTINSASAGNGSISVAFTPGNSNGATITEYTVSCGLTTANQFATGYQWVASQTGIASPITVSGLTNGTAYKCEVKAKNSAGYGNYSGPSSTTTPVAPVVVDNTPPAPPANPTLPTGGGTVTPTSGQTVTVTDNGGNGSTINLPTPPSSGTPGTGATVTVALPGTGNVAVSNNSAGTQLQVQSITLPGSSTPVSTVQVSTGSATLVASGAGQTLVTTGISNGLTVTSGGSGTSATVTASGNTQSIALTGTANLTLGSSLDTQRTTVTLTPTSSGSNSQANLNIGGQTLSVSTSGGNTQLQVVPTTVTGQRTNAIVVTGGSANITGQSGQVMNVIPTSTSTCAAGSTGGYFEARSNNAQSNVLSVNQGNLALTGYIPQGVVAYHYTSSTCNGFAMATPLDAGTAKEILIYQGEYVEVDKNGQPTKIVVRSKDGKSGAAGDPIQVPSSSGLGVDTLIPSLSQNTGRLPAGQTIAQIIESLIKLYNTSWTVSRQDTYGALRLTSGSGDKYALLPVGEVLADPERQDGVQCYGNGLCQITARNLTTSFNAALDAPQAFVAELSKIDPAAKVRLNHDGNLLLTLNNHTYLAQLSWNVAPAGAQGFASDASGITFSSASGKQALYPVLANLDRLQAILKKIDPTATALGDHHGAFTLQSQGQVYYLTPAWEVIATPAVHANDDYWLDNGAIYLNYLDGTAQGVSVK